MSDTSFLDYQFHTERCIAEYEKQRPFMLLQPRVEVLGELYRVIYGDVAACGDTPDAASRAFDEVWYGTQPNGYRAKSRAKPREGE